MGYTLKIQKRDYEAAVEHLREAEPIPFEGKTWLRITPRTKVFDARDRIGNAVEAILSEVLGGYFYRMHLDLDAAPNEPTKYGPVLETEELCRLNEYLSRNVSGPGINIK